ncbi:Stromal cell-derived factor 2 [Olea europaea subsp. europaea]|uniref:Stromal cell-derived factor 2 n=2 Tax=Olea europaea subsp. europaea TaxID=158383 RepID=A0A8S0UZE6_OLEEU|nr:Stromal cell-derived factor 2 [Olea europaea subsp. europaea]
MRNIRWKKPSKLSVDSSTCRCSCGSNFWGKIVNFALGSVGFNLGSGHAPRLDIQLKPSPPYIHVAINDSFLTLNIYGSVEPYAPTSINKTFELNKQPESQIESNPPSELRHRVKAPAVAPSGPRSNGLTRRKSAPSSTFVSAQKSGSARKVYRESVNSSSRSNLSSPFWQSTWFISILLAMAVSFFALAIYLLLTLNSDYTSTPVSAASEGVQITYGSTVKLMHERTKFRLHSHDVPYGSGSGQQSVTGFSSVDDSNSYWIVRPTLDSSAKQGDTIKSGTIIRLQHMRTRRWLHSHLHASPISGNLEVSCFGDDGNSDTGDYWRLEIEGNGKTWRQDQRVRLHHVDTGGYLHSHDKKYTRIAGGQQEVCGVREKRADNVWLAAEGVYLPTSGSK